jgi:hypothetical protein
MENQIIKTFQGAVTFGVLGLFGWGWLTADDAGPAAARRSEPVAPYAQSALVAALDGYRNQYSEARSNKNDIQQNRIHDARKTELLCQSDPNVQDWLVKVHKVNTNWVNDRQKAWVVLQVSKHVWFNSEIVDATENPAMFETIASLKQDDKVWVSGILRREGDLVSFGDYLREEKVRASGHGGCLRETSATQYGGMTTPEFGITLSSIGDYRAAAVEVPSATPAPVVIEASPPPAAEPPVVPLPKPRPVRTVQQ